MKRIIAVLLSVALIAALLAPIASAEFVYYKGTLTIDTPPANTTFAIRGNQLYGEQYDLSGLVVTFNCVNGFTQQMRYDDQEPGNDYPINWYNTRTLTKELLPGENRLHIYCSINDWDGEFHYSGENETFVVTAYADPNAPIIIKQPTATRKHNLFISLFGIPQGATLDFEAEAALPEGSGGSLSYAWYESSYSSSVADKLLGTGAKITLPDASTHKYYVVVTNTYEEGGQAKTISARSDQSKVIEERSLVVVAADEVLLILMGIFFYFPVDLFMGNFGPAFLTLGMSLWNLIKLPYTLGSFAFERWFV